MGLPTFKPRPKLLQDRCDLFPPVLHEYLGSEILVSELPFNPEQSIDPSQGFIGTAGLFGYYPGFEELPSGMSPASTMYDTGLPSQLSIAIVPIGLDITAVVPQILQGYAAGSSRMVLIVHYRVLRLASHEHPHAVMMKKY